jgi:hypothetical protein
MDSIGDVHRHIIGAGEAKRPARAGGCRCTRAAAEPFHGAAEGHDRGVYQCAGQHAPVAYFPGLPLVRPPVQPQPVPPARMGAVQHGSTAAHPDADGLAGTREDDDLHGWTREDVLPPDGMQEVSGSSPLSSTRNTRSGPKLGPLGLTVKIT